MFCSDFVHIEILLWTFLFPFMWIIFFSFISINRLQYKSNNNNNNIKAMKHWNQGFVVVIIIQCHVIWKPSESFYSHVCHSQFRIIQIVWHVALFALENLIEFWLYDFHHSSCFVAVKNEHQNRFVRQIDCQPRQFKKISNLSRCSQFDSN